MCLSKPKIQPPKAPPPPPAPPDLAPKPPEIGADAQAADMYKSKRKGTSALRIDRSGSNIPS